MSGTGLGALLLAIVAIVALYKFKFPKELIGRAFRLHKETE